MVAKTNENKRKLTRVPTMEKQFVLHEMLVRDTVELIDLPLSKLLLMNDSQYPWFILVPRIADVEDIYQLDWQDQQQLLNESSLLSEMLMQVFQGKKMNVAALGNVCSQLHIHHVVRFENDVAWPNPVWGQCPAVAYQADELETIKSKVMPLLNQILQR